MHMHLHLHMSMCMHFNSQRWVLCILELRLCQSLQWIKDTTRVIEMQTTRAVVKHRQLHITHDAVRQELAHMRQWEVGLHIRVRRYQLSTGDCSNSEVQTVQLWKPERMNRSKFGKEIKQEGSRERAHVRDINERCTLSHKTAHANQAISLSKYCHKEMSSI